MDIRARAIIDQYCQQDAISVEQTPINSMNNEFNKISHNTKVSESWLLDVENERLKRALKDKELELSQLKQAQKTPSNHRVIAEKLKTIESLIQINTLEPKMVRLSAKHDYQVLSSLKLKLLDMCTKEWNTTSLIYRHLMKSIFTDKIILGNLNSATLEIEYPVVMAACKDFMMAVRSDASIRMMHVCNTQICSNARKSIWKKSPQTVFKVKGRELKVRPAKSSLVDMIMTTPTSANQPQFASAMHRSEPSESDDDSSSGISTAFPTSSDFEDDDIDLDVTIPFEK